MEGTKTLKGLRCFACAGPLQVVSAWCVLVRLLNMARLPFLSLVLVAIAVAVEAANQRDNIDLFGPGKFIFSQLANCFTRVR